MANANEVTFEIVESLGTISTASSGWTKEINLVSWNGLAPKYDIREWSEDHSRMSRGITLTEDELSAIVDYYHGHELAKAHDSK